MPKKMQTTRILLTLWGFENETAKKGELTKRLVRKGESIKEYQPALEALIASNQITLQDGKYQLTASGTHLLQQELANSEFKFAGNVGEKTVNALLKWIRSAGVSGVHSNGKHEASIESYEEFKKIALDAYERLNQDYKMENLVPIYRIRREIGEQVSRSQFDKWLFEMQSQDILQLIGGEMPELTPDKADDSVKTVLGGVRYYAKRQ